MFVFTDKDAKKKMGKLLQSGYTYNLYLQLQRRMTARKVFP